MLKEKDKETQRLSAMFRDTEGRLHMAQETIRMMREQSCVQVAVKKEVSAARLTALRLWRWLRRERDGPLSCRRVSSFRLWSQTIHTREQQEGDYNPVSKKEETSTVTWSVAALLGYKGGGCGGPSRVSVECSLICPPSPGRCRHAVRFTDERVKAIKTGPWQPSEDRVLLQAQLYVVFASLELPRVRRTSCVLCPAVVEPLCVPPSLSPLVLMWPLLTLLQAAWRRLD